MNKKKTLVISNNKKLYTKKEKKLFLNLNCMHETISKKIFKENFFGNQVVRPSMINKTYVKNSYHRNLGF